MTSGLLRLFAEDTDRAITVADRELGRGRACLVIAEVGINHNGDIGLARASIAAAAQAGADVVKFQNYRTEDFVSDRALTISYRSQDKDITEPQYDLFKRCELSRADLRTLKQECDRHGVLFASTPCSRGCVAVKSEVCVGSVVAIGTIWRSKTIASRAKASSTGEVSRWYPYRPR